MTLPKPLPAGPWTVEVSGNSAAEYHRFVTFTRGHVLAMVEAAPDSVAMYHTLPPAVGANASRIFDRAVQLARKAGLLVYRGRKWVRP